MKRMMQVALAAATTALTTVALAGNTGGQVGFTELVDRLGEGNVPTGANVIVGLVEALDEGFYKPNTTLTEFDGKTFIDESGPPNGNSGHATVVASNFFGDHNANDVQQSIAPGIETIHLFFAEGWLGGDYLQYLASPSTPPIANPDGLKIYNNSWVGEHPSANTNNVILRRADFAVNRDDVLMISGVNNASGGSGNLPLLSHMYNGISVGRIDGGHQSGATISPFDGPDRLKPELVAVGDPDCCTSFATPVVSAAAALMVETASGLSPAGIESATRSEIVKAVLLAGTVHRDGWTNNAPKGGADRGATSQPIDATFGTGLLNVNQSHMIMSGGPHEGDPTPPSSGQIPFAGWSLASVGLDESRFYRVVLNEDASELSFVITWHRKVDPPFTSISHFTADLDLILWRVDGADDLVTLVGDDGVPFFDGGNVVSESMVDNVEHLYVEGLAAGTYMLEVRRQDFLLNIPSQDVAVAWLLPQQTLPGDVNGNGVVDVLDLIAIIVAWGPCEDPPDPCFEDLDGDGDVGVLDLIEVIVNFGG